MTETTDTKVNKLKINTVKPHASNIQDVQEFLHNDEVLNIAFENAPIGMTLADLNGNLLRVNETLPQMFGYSKKELTSMNFKELSLPDDLEVNLKLKDEAIEGKRDSYQLEKRYIHKDGHIIWGSLKATIIRDKKNVPLYFIGQVQDITKQKQAELTLKHKEEKFRLIFENAPIGKALISIDGRFKEVNTALCKMLGFTSQELKNKTFKDITHPDDLNNSLDLVSKLLKGEIDKIETEKRYISKNGKIVWALLKSALMYNDNNEPQYFVSQIVDITEQKIAEQELQFRSQLLNNQKDSVLVHDLEGKFIYINEAAYKTRGFTKDELLNLPLHMLSTPDSKELIKTRLKSLLGGDIATFERSHLRKDGSIMPVEVNSKLLELDEKKVVVAIARDITERKKSEQTLKESEEKCRKLIDSANDAIFLADAETGIIVNANKKAEELIGIRRDKIVGMHQMQLHPPEKADEYKKIFTDYVGKEQGVTPELLAQHKSGRKIPVEISSTVVDVGGKIYLQGIFRDITERKRSKELSDALNNINTVINSAQDDNEILKKVVVEAAMAIGCDASAIISLNDEQWIMNHSYGLPIKESIFISGEAIACSMRAVSENKIIIDDHTRKDKEQGCCSFMHKYNISSKLSAPLSVKGKVLGVIDFYYLKKPVPFSSSQIDFAKKLSASVALAIENNRLYQAERSIANTLQEAVLSVPEAIDGIEFGHFYKSATESAKVGGDFYDIFEIDDKRIGITVGDVSGKGVTAASLTSVVKNTIRAYAYQRYSTTRIVEMTNSVTIKQGDPAHFVTSFFGILDKDTGILSYCSCGHPPSMVKRKSSGVELLKTSSPALGLVEDNDFIEETVKLDKDDILILYTDGVTEARCLSKKDTSCGFYGENRLIDFIENENHANPETLAKKIYKSILTCTGCVLTDDVVLCTLSLK